MLSPLPYGIPLPVTLPFLEKIVGIVSRHRRGAILLFCFVLAAGMTGYHVLQRLGQIDRVFLGPDMKSLKALALYEIGAYSQAASHYRKDYADHLQAKNNVPPYLVPLLRQDSQRTIEWAEQELKREPENVLALLAIAQAAYDNREYSTAADYTRHVLARYWNHGGALLLAALIATHDPSQGDAFEYLDIALRAGIPIDNLLSFINVLEVTGHLQSQRRDERPSALLTLYYRILTLYDTGMVHRVMTMAHRAIAKGDHPGEAWCSIGVMFEKMGRSHKALEAYQEATRTNPHQANAYFRAARLYENESVQGNYDPHQYLFLQSAFRVVPTDRMYLSAIYHNNLARHDAYALTRLVRTALERDPSHVTAQVYLAWQLETLGENYQAKQIMQQTLTLDARSPEELELQSWAARRVGDVGLEETLLHRSVRLDPGRSDPHRALAGLHKRQDRVAEARREFEIAARMGAYRHQDEWLSYEWREFCALYDEAQPPPLCTPSR